MFPETKITEILKDCVRGLITIQDAADKIRDIIFEQVHNGEYS